MSSVVWYGQDKDSACFVFWNCFSWNLAPKFSVQFQSRLILEVELQWTQSLTSVRMWFRTCCYVTECFNMHYQHKTQCSMAQSLLLSTNITLPISKHCEKFSITAYLVPVFCPPPQHIYVKYRFNLVTCYVLRFCNKRKCLGANKCNSHCLK